MNRIDALNIYLGEKRKCLLTTLNVVLVIFIILEVVIWNDLNGLMSTEEYQEAREEWCKKSNQTSQCR